MRFFCKSMPEVKFVAPLVFFYILETVPVAPDPVAVTWSAANDIQFLAAHPGHVTP